MKLLLALALLLWPSPVSADDPGMAGWASHYGPGHGVAMPFCTWTLRHATGCGWVRIISDETGLMVEAPVIDYCLCHVEPSAHPDRIVDLQYGVVAALGLPLAQGMYPVRLWLIDGPVVPDTAMVPQ